MIVSRPAPVTLASIASRSPPPTVVTVLFPAAYSASFLTLPARAYPFSSITAGQSHDGWRAFSQFTNSVVNNPHHDQGVVQPLHVVSSSSRLSNSSLGYVFCIPYLVSAA